MRTFYSKAIIFLLLITLFIADPIPGMSQTVLIEETDLYPGGSAAGIQIGSDGTIYVLDQTNELWKVNPLTGVYHKYYPLGGDTLMDISLIENDGLWWSDDTTSFGTFDFTTNVLKTWSVDALNPEENSLNLGPVVNVEGIGWLASYFGPTFGLFSFDPTDFNLCLYQYPPPGLYAADLVFHDNFLWALDWFSNSILRMDPENGRLVKYATEREIYSSAYLHSDGVNLWWTEDILGGSVNQFNPVTHEMTVFDLPDDEIPRHLYVRAGIVFYTNVNGSFGQLDPDLANKTTSTLIENIIVNTIVPTCATLSSPSQVLLTPTIDSFDWTDGNTTFTEPQNGIGVFTLPDSVPSSAPFGIGWSEGFIWVSDSGRQKLIRMPYEIDDGQNFIFLPLIIK